MYKEWRLKKAAQKVSSKTLLEKLLATRGIVDKQEAYDFLNPLETNLTHPNAFVQMPKAVERLSSAIEQGEKILVYGDFDADGVTSTALLIRTLKELNANVDYFIPDRETDGHGLNSKAIVKLLTKQKPKIILTCDCASSDVEQVQFIKSFKVDVIITDHHETPEVLPNALAIINPKAPNALDEKLSSKEITYLTSLAGVGVAYKLASALLDKFDKQGFIPNILPYVTVGTISDVVPLIGENRYFVARGLQLISAGKHFGLKKLLESAGYVLDTGITSEQIAFGIAPRINASGRLDTTDDALKVLISDNPQEIEMSIISLNNFNKIRQELCEDIFLEADEMFKTELKNGEKNNAIVLFNPKWHIGIIGIVASKLVEKYYKPVFLMTYSEETKQVRCSSRGISEVNIYDVLCASAELFDGYGGHAMAGGLSFSIEKTSFDDVKTALNKTVDEILENTILKPTLEVDLNLEPDSINGNLISDIERLQPFGANNPNPVFAMYNLTLRQKKLMGSNRNHLKLVVEDSQNNTYDCIWWSKGDISLNSGDRLDIAFCPQINTYKGSTSIQLILQDIHADNLVEEDEELMSDEPQNSLKIYDHRKKTGIFSSVEDYVKTSNLKIAVFAEDKNILNKLKPYKALSEKVFNRQKIEASDAVMFFDYPASQEIFNEIIQKASPKFLHFMNYQVKKTDEKEFLKTFLGMLRFSVNNLNGTFDIERSASFLAMTKDVIIELLGVFEQGGIINILKKEPNQYSLQVTANADIKNALHTNLYKSFLQKANSVNDYKARFLDSELQNFCN